jgi:hypothetical protein
MPMTQLSPEREAKLSKALMHVHQLLEAYAPTWYTEPIKKKIEAALKQG